MISTLISHSRSRFRQYKRSATAHHVLGDDVGRVALDAVLVDVLAALQAAFAVDMLVSISTFRGKAERSQRRCR